MSDTGRGIAIVAVHGVTPQVRYGFQDDVAAKLCGQLNMHCASNGPWNTTVVYPARSARAAAGVTDVAEPSTITRVYQASEANPDTPTGDFFDVHEAYWSPLDKGKTNALSVGWWLLQTIFVPLNDTARYGGTLLKALFDLAYIFFAAIVCLLLIVFAASALGTTLQYAVDIVAGNKPAPFTWHDIFSMSWPFITIHWRAIVPGLGAAITPYSYFTKLTSDADIALIVGAIGAFLLFQVIRGISSVARYARILSQRDPMPLIARVLFLALLSAASFACFQYLRHTHVNPPKTDTLDQAGIFLILAVGALQVARSGVPWFLANFFGDVQVYTTRDQNSTFYALREAILEKVTAKIVDVLVDAPAGRQYERIYVLGHSLGSTIALDAIMRVYLIYRRASAISTDDWQRLRGFLTFGTALEKTKFFFNATDLTASQSQLQWNDELYGALFTADREVLTSLTYKGIYWGNSWYYTDFVADRINSYRSFAKIGERAWQARARRDDLAAKADGKVYAGRVVAENRAAYGPFPPLGWSAVTHSHYLDHDWFWHTDVTTDLGVLDVLTASCALRAADPQRFTDQDKSVRQPYETKSKLRAYQFGTSDVIK